MRHLQGLLPYALASAAVVVASAIALGATIRAPGAGPLGAAATSGASPAGSRATLSESGRMAYWRSAASGILELWVSDLDGGRRWTVATAGSGSDIALTRWSPDGNAVAYVIGGVTLAVSRLDGATAFLDIPGDLRTSSWRIVSFEWSTDSTRVAASLRAGSGLSNQSDVYLVNAKAGSVWERITTLGDAFAGQWISPTQLFIEEASGATLVLDVPAKALRPITGLAMTSPQIGRDGRVYFVGGQAVFGDVVTQPVANGWVWSATIDGDGLRRETRESHDQLRLFGILADGRAVVGVPGSVFVAGDAYVPLTFQAGNVRRVIVSDDGRRAIGITDQRILLIDPTKIPRSLEGGLPPANAVTVLLSSVRGADVWFPVKPVTLARSTRATPEGPAAKLAFVLGRSVWQADPGGEIRSVASDPNGFFAGGVRWSPSGDRLAIAGTVTGAPATSFISVIGAGSARRWEVPTRFPQGLSWSVDGSRVALWSAPAPRFDEFTTQLYEASTGRAVEKIAGRAVFVSGATIVLTDGDMDTAQQMRVGQRVDVIGPSGTRTLTDARRLAGHPILRDLPDGNLPTLIGRIAPSAAGDLLAVWVYRGRVGGVTIGTVVVVRVSDGEPVWQNRFAPQAPIDAIWSPSGHLLAWTAPTPGPDGTPTRGAVVDPIANRTLVTVEGRFAGWAPDGQWIYVARDEGLFAMRVDGTGAVRVNGFGVPVVAAKP